MKTSKTVTTITGKVAYDVFGSFEDCSPGLYVGNDNVESVLDEYVGKTVKVTIEEVEARRTTSSPSGA